MKYQRRLESAEMILTRCTEQLGGHNVYQNDPAIEEFDNVVCIPPSRNNPRRWGIFDQNRRLIPATGFYRGGYNRHLVMQDDTTDMDFTSIKDQAPEDTYFYGGKVHPHYGHFVLSTLSRFWPLVKYGKPKCKILMHEEQNLKGWFGIPHLAFYFGHLGLSEDDFVQFDKAIKIRRLIVAVPSFEEEHLAHHAFAQLGNEIGKRALKNETLLQSDRPVYLSKSNLQSGVWRFTNEDDVTNILVQKGVDIVYPELLSLTEQIKLFVERKLVISSMASCLHTSIFSWTKPNIIGIGHDANVVTNYTLSDQVNGINGQYLYPRDGVTDIGPCNAFTRNTKIDDPREVAEDILRIVDKEYSNVARRKTPENTSGEHNLSKNPHDNVSIWMRGVRQSK